MLQQLRERLTLVLIVLLPFHALLLTVGTRILRGPNNAPWSVLAVWKEALLGIILLIAACEWLMQKRWMRFRPDLLDGLILTLFALGAVVSYIRSDITMDIFAYGVRYDFVFLGAFFALRRVSWSERFIHTALQSILVVAGIVVGYGLLTMILPQTFFTMVGYSDLHSLYNADGPIAAFQYIGDLSLRRMQSTFSGPNHLGIWLLLPISIGLDRLWRTNDKWMIALLGLFGIGLLLTFSRSAWIAGAVITLCMLWKRGVPQPLSFLRNRRIQFLLFNIVTILLIATVYVRPEILTRIQSTSQRVFLWQQAIERMDQQPLGSGVGTAGPASNRMTDTCAYFSAGADTSWAIDRPDLCVFAGPIQVQPKDRTCHCPLLTENWYLQMGVEMGWFGLILFVALTFVLLRRLPRTSPMHYAFLGVSVAALFLHAWEDSAIAYSLWMLMAAMMSFLPLMRTEKS